MRSRALAVVGAAVGAGLVLLAASRRWSTVVEAMPAPLPERVTTHTGADLVPALPALALVALAGAGGLLAAASLTVRRVVAGLVTLAGLGVVGFAAGQLGAGPRAAGWSALALVGGLLVGAAGALGWARGRDWSALGRRFDRASAVDADAARDPGAGPDVWAAIDRGDDPTR